MSRLFRMKAFLLKICLYLLAGGQLFFPLKNAFVQINFSGYGSYRSEGKRFCCFTEWGLNKKRVYVGENVWGLLSHYGILKIV